VGEGERVCGEGKKERRGGGGGSEAGCNEAMGRKE